MRKRAVAAARGREAQLGLGLQVFGVRVKVAVRRDKKDTPASKFGSRG